MARVRWMVLCLALLLAGLMAVGSPRTAVAALDGRYLYSLQDDAGIAVPPDQPIVSVPGVFSLWLGQGFSMLDEGIQLETAQVDLPVINATATVNGLTMSLRDKSYGWDSITLNQAAPMGNEAVTVSNLQADVGGKATNYSTDVSTRIDVHPGENVQAGATLGLSYDGMTGQASFSMADGAASVAVGPATIAVDGMSVQDGAMTVGAAQVLFPDAGVGVRIDGYTMANGQSDWKAFTWYGQEFKLGDVLTLSDTLVVAPGPSTATAAPIGATTHFASRWRRGPSRGSARVYLRPGYRPAIVRTPRRQRRVWSPRWNVAFTGVNADKAGAQVETITMTGGPGRYPGPGERPCHEQRKRSHL